MKKILSLVLIAVLVLGMVPFSFAADMTAGEQLKAYGIVDGYEDGTLREENALTRAQMMKILVDLYDAEDEVAVYPLDAPFTDIEGHWAQDVIDYAVGSGWTNGTSPTTFAPDAPVTDAQLATFLMRALGYEPVDWTNAVAEIAELGVVVAPTTSATRGDAFASIVEALDVMPKDKEETLGTELALEGYEAPYVAPETLEVVSVEAINMKQIEVVFNKAIDAAGDEDNYDLTSEGTAVLNDDSDFELLEDGMTVVITLTTEADQQDVETLTIDGIEDEDENSLDEVEFEIEFLDTTIPTVLSAEVVGNDTIKVTFSEPMEPNFNGNTEFDKDGFEIDGGDINIKEVLPVNNDTEANIVLYSDLDEGDITVAVNTDTEDYAGFGASPTTLTVSVEEDETAPVIVDYKDASKTGVTIVWSEDIEIADYDKANYYHTNSNNEIDANLVDADVDGAEMTLDFTDNELPEGTAYIYVAADSVNDLWDNENDKEQFVIMVEIDETAPMVDDVDVDDEDTIMIDFDEELDVDSVEEDAFTLLKDGEEEEDMIAGVELSADMLTVTIDFDDELSGDYTIAIEDLEDLAGNEIADVEVEFTVDDMTNPDADDFTATIYKEGVSEEQMIKIDFDEEMSVDGDFSVLDLAKYSISVDGTVVDLEDMDEDYVSIKAVDDKTAVEIMVPTVADDADYGIDLDASAGTTTIIMIGKVADAAGNTTPGVSVELTENAGDANKGLVRDAGTVGIDTVEATDVDTIVVTLLDELDEFESDDISLYVDVNDDGDYDAGETIINYSKVKLSTDSDGNSVVTYTLAEADELTYDAKLSAHKVGVMTVVAPDSVNQYGEALDGSLDVQADDVIAPEVDYVVFVDSQRIQVFFTENLDAGLFAGGLDGFSVTGGTLDDVAPGTTPNVVELTSAVADSDFTKNTNVSYDEVVGLADAAGNEVASFTESDALDIAAISVVNDPADNTFTVTYNWDDATVVATGDVDMDTATVGVQDAITINNVTYTVTDALGVLTVTASGNADATADAQTSDFTITIDGVTTTLEMDVPATTDTVAGANPSIAAQ